MVHSFCVILYVLKSYKAGDTMPRPVKRRIVCGIPEFDLYAPVNNVISGNTVQRVTKIKRKKSIGKFIQCFFF